MGSVGAGGRSSTAPSLPSRNPKDYQQFTDNTDYREWLNNSNNSNFSLLKYTENEKTAIYQYTGNAYKSINAALYNKGWDDMSATTQLQIQQMDKGLSKFDLNKGIEVTRRCDFQVFGASDTDKMSEEQVKDYLSKSNGVLQNNAFMSFSMDTEGRSIAGEGVVIHLRVPPTKGAGAPVYNISQHRSEREFVLNRNAVLQFDQSTIRKEGGNIHITAYYLGRAEKRTFE